MPDGSANPPDVAARAALGARLRGAFWLHGLSPTDVAERLDVSTNTVHRVYRGDAAASPYQYERAHALALALGIPRWFLDEGWEGANVPDDVSLAEEVQALRGQMDAVLKIIGTRALAGAASAVRQQGQLGDHGDTSATGPTP